MAYTAFNKLQLNFVSKFMLFSWSLVEISFVTNVLRYYATFKVRKFELLFNKINTCLPKSTTCIGLQAKQIFSVNINIHIFSVLDVAFAILLSYFQKLQLFVVKNFWTNFLLPCTSICMSSKRVPQIFNILSQTGDNDIFVLLGVLFSRYVLLKSSFSDENT